MLCTAEHIYEGVWIKRYLDYLVDTYNKCDDIFDIFFTDRSSNKNLDLGPDLGGHAKTYVQALMMQLATDYTYAERMTMLTKRVNIGKNAVSKIESPTGIDRLADFVTVFCRVRHLRKIQVRWARP